jgi:hypothetical protein
MLKNITALFLLFYFNCAFADDQRTGCGSIDNGTAEKILDLSQSSEDRMKKISVCKVKNVSKYFVIFDDTPFIPFLTYQTSGQKIIKTPEKIVNHSETYSSWIVSLENSEFKDIETKFKKLEVTLKENEYGAPDSFETCISSKTMKQICIYDPEDHTKERGLQTLVDVRHLLAEKFSGVAKI